jgi:hypothetical protein
MSEFEGQEKLEELRKKHPSQLTEADLDFLRARRSYLHAHEKNAFGIEHDAEPEDEKSNDDEDEDENPELTKAQLQEALTAKGVKFNLKATKAELQALLDAVPQE